MTTPGKQLPGIPRAVAALVMAGALAIAAAGCTSGPDISDDGRNGHIVVFAAASLKGAFEQLGQDFEDTHDGVNVEFNFAGSSDLVAQIQQGVGANVFASADEANMAKLSADDLDGTPQIFATNQLAIAVPVDNPAQIESFADLANPQAQVVVCAPQVPCGAAAEKAESAAGIELKPVSEEQSVTDVLNKVIAGEADAGLVYVTDVKAAGGKVLGIDLGESTEVINNYPIASLPSDDQTAWSRKFVELVLSQAGQRVLASYGFGKP